MTNKETLIAASAMFVTLACMLFVVHRDTKRDAERWEAIQPSRYLATPEIFIDRCGKPVRVRDGVLDYGAVSVSFRPAADGTAAHFYERDGVTEISGEAGLKRLGCTL